MAKPSNSGPTRIIRAAGYSALGLKAAWRFESAFRQECLFVLLLAPAAFWLGESPLQTGALLAAALQLLVVELLNSAIEAVVDRIGAEQHELAGRAKDMASAAVALSIALLLIVWIAVGWQRFG